MIKKAQERVPKNYIIKIISQKILQKRMAVLFALIFFTIYVYLKPVIAVSKEAEVSVTLWILSFLYSHIYFMMILFFGAAYLFSNIPFLHQWTLYHMIRLGKKRWFLYQIVSMWFQALCYSGWVFLSGIIILLPRLKWSKDWGEIIYSLTLTENNLTDQIYFSASYGIVNRYHPFTFFIYCFLFMLLLVFFTGCLMLFFSLYSSRQIAMGVTMLFITFIIMEKNIFFTDKFIWYSPFSWMNLNRILDFTEANMPPVLYIMISLVTFICLCLGLSFSKICKMDIQWNREEL